MDAQLNKCIWTFVILAALFKQSFQTNLECRVCPSTRSLDRCPTMRCQSNELCYVGDRAHIFTRSYTAKCMSTHVCKALTNAIMRYIHTSSMFGRRRGSIHMCDICCGDNLCNSRSCRDVKRDMYKVYSQHLLNMDTLSLNVTHHH